MKQFLLTCVCALLLGCVTPQAVDADKPALPTVGDYRATKLLHADDFDNGLDSWQVEQQPGGTVQIKDGKLVIEDAGGCTVWFKQKLEAPVLVEFDATMIKAGGKHDRVSDLNSFMMAIDPENEDLLAGGEKRGGKFGRYNALRLYYVGYGANDNTTTRFRRYPGNGSKPLLPEHDLEGKHKPNMKRRVQIMVADGTYQYWIDGERIYHIKDDEPFTQGWFGLRTVRNHMHVERFRVWRVERAEADVP